MVYFLDAVVSEFLTKIETIRDNGTIEGIQYISGRVDGYRFYGKTDGHNGYNMDYNYDHYGEKIIFTPKQDKKYWFVSEDWIIDSESEPPTKKYDPHTFKEIYDSLPEYPLDLGDVISNESKTLKHQSPKVLKNNKKTIKFLIRK
jgi:hypothetical protein